eukprot:scaffold50473_cov59-Attheya_sp.AAC.5
MTSNLCEVSITLVTDVESTVSQLAVLEAKPAAESKSIEVNMLIKLQEWITLELNPLYILYAKLSTAVDKLADKFEAVMVRLLALELKTSNAPPALVSGKVAMGMALMFPTVADSDLNGFIEVIHICGKFANGSSSRGQYQSGDGKEST